ncbi:hypothetical protein SCB49_02159 [unidentified eubacterium SCB49]|nr:hypothetical protein SCB49_02159 [unidentified eubacterium SCB49]
MTHTRTHHYSGSPIYNKAIEILVLSRNIATYLVDDFTSNARDYEEHPGIYFSGDIIQQSNSLAPEILKAESIPFQEDRKKHIASVEKLTKSLTKNCERLEKFPSNGRDFLPILRKELKKFRKLQRIWIMTL